MVTGMMSVGWMPSAQTDGKRLLALCAPDGVQETWVDPRSLADKFYFAASHWHFYAGLNVILFMIMLAVLAFDVLLPSNLPALKRAAVILARTPARAEERRPYTCWAPFTSISEPEIYELSCEHRK